MEGLRRVLLPLAVVTFAVAACAETATAAGGWRSGPSLPQPRSEVAGALFQARIAVVGGFRADASSSARVDMYDPDGGRWTRLTDLPLAVNHAMAAAGEGRLYVVGGYAAGTPQRLAVAWNGRRWLRLPPLPEPRAAAGAAFADGRLYIVGGVGKGDDSPAGRSSTSRRAGGGRGFRVRRRVSTSASSRSPGVCTRPAVARRASTRTSTCSRSIGPRSDAGYRCRPSRPRVEERDSPSWRGWSSPRAASSRAARSRRCSPTTGWVAVGGVSRTSRLRATAWPWWAPADASMRSAAARSPA